MDEKGNIKILKKGRAKIVARYENGSYSTKNKYKTTLVVSE